MIKKAEIVHNESYDETVAMVRCAEYLQGLTDAQRKKVVEYLISKFNLNIEITEPRKEETNANNE